MNLQEFEKFEKLQKEIRRQIEYIAKEFAEIYIDPMSKEVFRYSTINIDTDKLSFSYFLLGDEFGYSSDHDVGIDFDYDTIRRNEIIWIQLTKEIILNPQPWLDEQQKKKELYFAKLKKWEAKQKIEEEKKDRETFETLGKKYNWVFK